MMEKYSTYDVYKNKNTGEILRVSFSESLEKKAEDMSQWEKLDEDPEKD